MWSTRGARCTSAATSWPSPRVQARQGDRRSGRDEAEGGRQVRPRRSRGGADPRTLPYAALTAHKHQQRHRAPELRDTPLHPRGRHLSRRGVGEGAGDGKAQVRGDRASIWTRRCWTSDHADGRQPPAGICARVWTVPVNPYKTLMKNSLLKATTLLPFKIKHWT